MSATTALDGLAAVGGTGGRPARARVDGRDREGDDGRGEATRTTPLGLAARPRAATPIFVDGGRRARWVRRLGGVVGTALGVWLAAVGLALVGLGSTAGPSVATDGAVVHEPAGDAAGSTAEARPDGMAPLFAPPAGPPAPTRGEAGGGGATGDEAASATGDVPLLLAPSDRTGAGSPAGRTTADGGGEAAPARPGADEGRDARVR